MRVLSCLSLLVALAGLGVPLLLSHVAAGWLAIRSSNWHPKMGLPDLQGQVALVTGATTGIGRATALHLAKKGAKVLVHGRSGAKAEPVVQEILAAGGQAEAVVGDLSDLTSVSVLAGQVAEKLGEAPLDIGILNAGVCKDGMGQTDAGFELTKDGFELHIQVNHLAHQLLAEKLLKSGHLKAGATRLVSVSSGLEEQSYPEGIRYEDWRAKGKEYKDVTAYGQSKLANIMMASEIHNRFGLESVSVHPGIINTDIQRHVLENGGHARKALVKWFEMACMTSEQGSFTQLWAATAPGVTKGFYWPVAREREPGHAAFNNKTSAELWEKSHEHIRLFL